MKWYEKDASGSVWWVAFDAFSNTLEATPTRFACFGLVVVEVGGFFFGVDLFDGQAA